MPNYRRNRVGGGCYFFTVNLAVRNPDKGLLHHIDLLREAVQRVRSQRNFHIDAWVVLPDHMHAIWTLPPDDYDYSTRWRLIKHYYAKHIPHGELYSERRQARGERGVWQRRFWEHTIRNEESYAACLDYVHINPIKHGYVDKAKDWPYSTFKRWVKRGRYSPHWPSDG